MPLYFTANALDGDQNIILQYCLKTARSCIIGFNEFEFIWNYYYKANVLYRAISPFHEVLEAGLNPLAH